ncbi:MDR family MFS transporter [Streptomyces sp. RerS4]|uniref:MDR family MFS transporter n=1 Tax=Streptomyces sp. RerS4 TaxID=2942449 RepID=UPI00201C0B1A|nr:MDR family MFS transporter [Streptomyces sp. RerS4]UQX05458.1 MFS transporter [Streptomyces sp. RerS4]
MAHHPAQGGPPIGTPPRPRHLLVMSAVVVAMLLAALDSLILGTAMPTIVAELGGLEHLSWVASAYMLATAASTPVWGKLGDMYGRKAVFLTSIGIFLAGSVVAGMAQSMGQLIGFRVLQGLGGGGLMVGALALIGELITPAERGKFQAMASTVMGAAMVGGPLAGGFLTDHLGWRWCFYLNVPLGLAAFLAIAMGLHLPKKRSQAPLDYLGAALLTAVITALVLITTWGGTRYDWTSPAVIGLAVVAVAGTAAFLTVERRAAAPILPLDIFRSANFSWANIVAFLFGFVMVAAMTFLPIYQQTVQGASATSAGILMLPLLLAMVGVNTLAGRLIAERGDFKLYAVTGGALLVVGAFLLSLMDTTTSRLTTGVYMAVFGAGLGLLMQVTLSVAMESVEMRNIGVASSTVTLSRTIGGSFGVSLAGIVFADRVNDAAPSSGAAGGEGHTQLSAESLAALPEQVRAAYEQAVADGTHAAFLIAAALAAAAFIGAWFIKARPRPADRPGEARPAVGAPR